MTRCAICGVENPQGSQFCNECGNPIQTDNLENQLVAQEKLEAGPVATGDGNPVVIGEPAKGAHVLLAILAVVAGVVLICMVCSSSNSPAQPATPVQAVAPVPQVHAAKALKQPKPRKKTRAEIAAENAAFDRDLCKQGTLLAAQLGQISPSDYVDSCK